MHIRWPSAIRATVVAVGVLLAGVVPASAAASTSSSSPAPPGYELTERRQVAPGLVHERYVRGGEQPQVVNVARLARDAGLALRTVLSNEAVAEDGPRRERTSAMCQRVSCLVAVNGDFARLPDDTPFGGVVAAGELVRTPSPAHHQLSVLPDGTLTTESFEWSGRVVPTDLRSLRLTGVNVTRQPDDLVLYTPRYGPSTGTNPHGAELVLQVLEPAPPLPLGATVLLEVVALRDGQPPAPLPEGHVVLSGHGAGAAALRELWHRISTGEAGPTVLARLDTSRPVVQSVGGTPILVRDGQKWVGHDGSGFISGRHPRTMVAWTGHGETLLVTADGRQPGYAAGLSLPEAADLLLALGAVEGINLDGGGSTTFVVGGQVQNRPSDRLVRRSGAERISPVERGGDQVLGHVERPVTVSLTVVARDAAAAPTAIPPSLAALDLPPTTLGEAVANDAGSNHLAALPALVWQLESDRVARIRLAVVATAALVAAAAGLGAVTRHRLLPVAAVAGRRPGRHSPST